MDWEENKSVQWCIWILPWLVHIEELENMVYGLFVPKTFRSPYAVDDSFLGRFVPWTIRSLDVSFHGRATL